MGGSNRVGVSNCPTCSPLAAQCMSSMSMLTKSVDDAASRVQLRQSWPGQALFGQQQLSGSVVWGGRTLDT